MQFLLSKSDSKEILAHCSSFESTRQDSSLNFAIIARKCSAKAKTEAKANISCVNCGLEEKRYWQGWIIGKGITGSLHAFLKRIKYKYKPLKRNTPLMRLLTLCDNCAFKLDWHGKPDRDHIMSVGRLHKISASLVLTVSYKEVEQVISSKFIVMGGPFMNTIKTVGMDGEEKDVDLLFQTI